MLKTKQELINKIHLIISVCIVVPVAFVYGFQPDFQFDIYINTIDEHSFFKAIMGLYLGFSALWVFGIFNERFLKSAIITNMIFMLGLGFGRLVSLMLDGTPTFAYTFGAAAELVLGFYGAQVLKRIK